MLNHPSDKQFTLQSETDLELTGVSYIISRENKRKGGFVSKGGFGECALVPGFGAVVPCSVPSFWFLVPSFRFCTLVLVWGWEEPSMDQYQCRGKVLKNFQDHWSIRISPGKGMDQ